MKYMGMSEDDSYNVIKDAVKLAEAARDKYFKCYPEDAKSKLYMHRKQVQLVEKYLYFIRLKNYLRSKNNR